MQQQLSPPTTSLLSAPSTQPSQPSAVSHLSLMLHLQNRHRGTTQVRASAVPVTLPAPMALGPVSMMPSQFMHSPHSGDDNDDTIVIANGHQQQELHDQQQSQRQEQPQHPQALLGGRSLWNFVAAPFNFTKDFIDYQDASSVSNSRVGPAEGTENTYLDSLENGNATAESQPNQESTVWSINQGMTLWQKQQGVNT
jgi:hypothetical protein